MLNIFDNIKLILENNQLKKENKELYEENKQNRNDIEDLELQRMHAKLLAEHTISQLNKLEAIDHSGNSEESKKKSRNIVINDLRKQNINIINELSNKFGSDR